ncbi:MAG: hydroxyisourate hydrolase [Candidatus Dormibacteraeota bacterium]|uniref:Hydroxyisourate hydrolase n=1 Tax=Candidatus Dormiibacter inghamiae TaxID=3127013 RepID=A0A934N5Q4_9BACT|nr:hydroxyisourate hydrolase [Candidatus Dormibacteraeota bacterium]MBJ7606865.1 hydroxyisourate hydrolase [Candidatus Dormibacteraeota bacterium]
MDQSGTTGTTLSTHVLDVSRGEGAANVEIELRAGGSSLGRARTDAGGRIAQLSEQPMSPGRYTVIVRLDGYFGSLPHLLTEVTLELDLSESRHYHVPLLIGPYLLSTYRGT